MTAAKQETPNGGRVDRLQSDHNDLVQQFSDVRATVNHLVKMVWWVIGILVLMVVGGSGWMTNIAINQATFSTRQVMVLDSIDSIESRGERRDTSIGELVRVTDRLVDRIEAMEKE